MMTYRDLTARALRAALCLALALGTARAVSAGPSDDGVPLLFVSSTVPENGDLSPSGVAFVPSAFPRGGALAPGDVLVSNWSDRSSFQGFGTTIVRVTPNGAVAPYVAPGESGAARVFFQSSRELRGLTSALGVLQRGFVLVGNVPTTDGSAETLEPGALQVIDRSGASVAVLKDAKFLDSPWALAIDDQGAKARVFVANAASGTVARLDLSVGSTVSVQRMTLIAKGYASRASGTQLLGPAGLAYDPRRDVLFVTSPLDNAVYAIARAGRASSAVDKGALVFKDPHLHGPLGLTFAGNGNLLTANGDAVGTDFLHPAELVEFTRSGEFVRQSNIDAGQGAAFGLASRPSGPVSVLAATSSNANDVLVFNAGAQPRAEPVVCVPPTEKAEPPSEPPPSSLAVRNVRVGGGGTTGQPPAKRALEPLCPAGQIPLVRPFPGNKGNPLLRPFPQLPDGPARFFSPGDQDFPYGKDLLLLKSVSRAVLPPLPCPGIIWGTGCYYYGAAAGFQANIGGAATATVARPAVNTSTNDPGNPNTWDHSLVEMAVSDTVAQQNIVEIGWRVSPLRYLNDNPYIFVYHWSAGAQSCYDGCGWVQNPLNSAAFPGRDLSGLEGLDVQFGVMKLNSLCGSSATGNWWVWFNDGTTNDWMGCFPGTLWNPSLSSTLVQWFGEVFTTNGVPQKTQMGNGLFPTTTSAAHVTQMFYIDAGGALKRPLALPILALNPLAYGAKLDSTPGAEPTLMYGGPGQP